VSTHDDPHTVDPEGQVSHDPAEQICVAASQHVAPHVVIPDTHSHTPE
jgi:hypothetical protein